MAPHAASYDVSVKVVDTLYVVLYTPALGEETVKYAAGRDLLVLVGKNTITYNDILGRSFTVPIQSQKPAANLKQSKSVSRAAEQSLEISQELSRWPAIESRVGDGDVDMRRNDRATLHTKLALSLGAATMVVLAAMFAAEAKAQTSGEGLPNLEARVEPLRPGVTESQVLAELAAHNEERRTSLHDYTVLRTYQVVDPNGKVHATEIGRMEFFSPDKKAFTITAESGSGLVRHMALNPLINSEIEAAAGKEHHDSAISTDNYSLNLLGEQQLGQYRCFVAEAVPKRKDKYLFEGKVWIDVNDYSVVRIEGHPAKKLSIWIQHADFVRQYQKLDGFWLPEKDQTLVQVRLYGKKLLKIEHRNYAVNAGQSTNARSTIRETAVTQTN